MDATTILVIVLLVVATAACSFVMWAVFELVKTLRSARSLAERLETSLIPLLNKVDVTVDALNVELLRIDEILTSIEEVTDRVSSTSRTVQEVAHAPAEIVGGIADRVRKILIARRQRRAAAEANMNAESERADSDVVSAE